VDNSATTNLFFTNDSNYMICVRKNRVTAWDTSSRALCCNVSGEFVGISRDEQILLTITEQDYQAGRLSTGKETLDYQAYRLATGDKLDKDDIDPKDFAFHQRVVVIGKPRDGYLLVWNVLKARVVKRIRFPRFASQVDWKCPAQRIYAERYVVVRVQWYKEEYEADDMLGYDIRSGRQIFSYSSNQSRKFQITWSAQRGELAIVEVGYIRIYDLAGVLKYSGKRYVRGNAPSIVRASSKTERYNEYRNEQGEIFDPQDIVSISLHPTRQELVAVAYDNEIQFLDMNRKIPDPTHSSWSLVKKVARIQEQHPIEGIAFTETGEQIVSMISDGTIHLWNVTHNKLIAKFEQ